MNSNDPARHSTSSDWDVVIVGGGPVGSTAASLLRKYAPELSVLVVEKEAFPRDHIGESQLPAISAILNEMGVWDKVEAADFPLKIGASYTWGRNDDRWDFDFYPVELWEDEPRPGRYAGQRKYTAFQVDRSRYDQILLDHAVSLGAALRQPARVTQVHHEGDRITGLQLDDGTIIRGRHYIDGSGVHGLFRRALGIGSYAPQELRNIAIWDYWENAEWAVEIGVGATRIQVRSLAWGWIWFIPIGPTKTSIGLVCPSHYYRESGKSPEALYHEAINAQSDIAGLIKSATPRGSIETCKDWSHLTDRIAGENWFICGEAAGFADPILSAGMTLAHSSAREAAYIIMELERGELDAAWLREQYNDRNRSAIRQHIRFAQYWYSANSCFTDLKDHCASIAKEAGLKLSPQQAWRWLSVGGFSNDAAGRAMAGSFDVASAKQILELFDGHRKVEWLANGYNVYKLNLHGAEIGKLPRMEDGRIELVDCYIKGDRKLPYSGYFGRMIDLLHRTSDGSELANLIRQDARRQHGDDYTRSIIARYLQALEIMIQDGWVQRKIDKKRPIVSIDHEASRHVRSSAETEQAVAEAGRAHQIKSNI